MIRVIVVLALGLCLAACGENPRAEVKAAYQHGEDAIRVGGATELTCCITAESVEMHREIIRLAMHATEREMMSQRPARINAVITLRNRATPDEIRNMTVESYFAWMIREELLIVDADWDIFPHSVSAHGNTAVLKRGIKVDGRLSSRSPRMGRRGRGIAGALARGLANGSSVELVEGLEIHYVNLDGSWLQDEAADEATTDDWLRTVALENQMNIVDCILALERQDFGSLKPDLWRPAGR